MAESFCWDDRDEVKIIKIQLIFPHNCLGFDGVGGSTYLSEEEKNFRDDIANWSLLLLLHLLHRHIILGGNLLCYYLCYIMQYCCCSLPKVVDGLRPSDDQKWRSRLETREQWEINLFVHLLLDLWRSAEEEEDGQSLGKVMMWL